MERNLISPEAKHWKTMDVVIYLIQNQGIGTNERTDSDIFLRGLMDGYKLEEERIQRMRREKEEEVLIESKVKSRVKEW